MEYKLKISTWDKIKKTFTSGLLSVFLFSSIAPAYAQASVWEERRAAVAKMKEAEKPLAEPQETLLAQLPRIHQTALPNFGAALGEQPSVLDSLPTAAVSHIPITNLKLPLAYANLKSAHFPAGWKPSDLTVLNLQDVHMNAEAQTNISKSLQGLIEQGQVDMVALEGAFKDIDVSGFRSFEDQKSVRMVADYFLKENKLSGAIHTALTSPPPRPSEARSRPEGADKSFPSFVGVDDQKLHAEHIQAYKDSVGQAAALKKDLEQKEAELNQRKASVYNPALLAFDRKVSAYRTGSLPLGDYVKDLSVVRDPEPVVGTFLKALSMEKSLDFDKVEAERGKMVQALVAELSQAQQTQLMNMSLAFRMGKVSNADFYKYLDALCWKAGIAIKKYPAMQAYVEYVVVSDRINAEAFLSELRSMESRIYESLSQTKEEKVIIARSRQIYLTGKLLDFSLTPEEWNEYKDSADANPALSTFKSFFEHAQLRDSALTGNLLSQAALKHAKLAVLVTGGYHSEGVTKILHDKGIATITMAPKITKIEGAKGTEYLSVFTQEKTPLEKLFDGDRLFVVQTPLTASIAGQIASIVEVFSKVTHGISQGTSSLASLMVGYGNEFAVHWKIAKGGNTAIETSGPQGIVESTLSLTEDGSGIANVTFGQAIGAAVFLGAISGLSAAFGPQILRAAAQHWTAVQIAPVLAAMLTGLLVFYPALAKYRPVVVLMSGIQRIHGTNPSNQTHAGSDQDFQGNQRNRNPVPEPARDVAQISRGALEAQLAYINQQIVIAQASLIHLEGDELSKKQAEISRLTAQARIIEIQLESAPRNGAPAAAPQKTSLTSLATTIITKWVILPAFALATVAAVISGYLGVPVMNYLTAMPVLFQVPLILFSGVSLYWGILALAGLAGSGMSRANRFSDDYVSVYGVSWWLETFVTMAIHMAYYFNERLADEWTYKFLMSHYTNEELKNEPNNLPNLIKKYGLRSYTGYRGQFYKEISAEDAELLRSWMVRKHALSDIYVLHFVGLLFTAIFLPFLYLGNLPVDNIIGVSGAFIFGFPAIRHLVHNIRSPYKLTTSDGNRPAAAIPSATNPAESGSNWQQQKEAVFSAVRKERENRSGLYAQVSVKVDDKSVIIRSNADINNDLDLALEELRFSRLQGGYDVSLMVSSLEHSGIVVITANDERAGEPALEWMREQQTAASRIYMGFLETKIRNEFETFLGLAGTTLSDALPREITPLQRMIVLGMGEAAMSNSKRQRAREGAAPQFKDFYLIHAVEHIQYFARITRSVDPTAGSEKFGRLLSEARFRIRQAQLDELLAKRVSEVNRDEVLSLVKEWLGLPESHSIVLDGPLDIGESVTQRQLLERRSPSLRRAAGQFSQSARVPVLISGEIQPNAVHFYEDVKLAEIKKAVDAYNLSGSNSQTWVISLGRSAASFFRGTSVRRSVGVSALTIILWSFASGSALAYDGSALNATKDFILTENGILVLIFGVIILVGAAAVLFARHTANSYLREIEPSRPSQPNRINFSVPEGGDLSEGDLENLDGGGSLALKRLRSLNLTVDVDRLSSTQRVSFDNYLRAMEEVVRAMDKLIQGDVSADFEVDAARAQLGRAENELMQNGIPAETVGLWGRAFDRLLLEVFNFGATPAAAIPGVVDLIKNWLAKTAKFPWLRSLGVNLLGLGLVDPNNKKDLQDAIIIKAAPRIESTAWILTHLLTFAGWAVLNYFGKSLGLEQYSSLYIWGTGIILSVIAGFMHTQVYRWNKATGTWELGEAGNITKIWLSAMFLLIHSPYLYGLSSGASVLSTVIYAAFSIVAAHRLYNRIAQKSGGFLPAAAINFSEFVPSVIGHFFQRGHSGSVNRGGTSSITRAAYKARKAALDARTQGANNQDEFATAKDGSYSNSAYKQTAQFMLKYLNSQDYSDKVRPLTPANILSDYRTPGFWRNELGQGITPETAVAISAHIFSEIGVNLSPEYEGSYSNYINNFKTKLAQLAGVNAPAAVGYTPSSPEDRNSHFTRHPENLRVPASVKFADGNALEASLAGERRAGRGRIATVASVMLLALLLPTLSHAATIGMTAMPAVSGNWGEILAGLVLSAGAVAVSGVFQTSQSPKKKIGIIVDDQDPALKRALEASGELRVVSDSQGLMYGEKIGFYLISKGEDAVNKLKARGIPNSRIMYLGDARLKGENFGIHPISKTDLIASGERANSFLAQYVRSVPLIEAIEFVTSKKWEINQNSYEEGVSVSVSDYRAGEQHVILKLALGKIGREAFVDIKLDEEDFKDGWRLWRFNDKEAPAKFLSKFLRNSGFPELGVSLKLSEIQLVEAYIKGLGNTSGSLTTQATYNRFSYLPRWFVSAFIAPFTEREVYADAARAMREGKEIDAIQILAEFARDHLNILPTTDLVRRFEYSSDYVERMNRAHARGARFGAASLFETVVNVASHSWHNITHKLKLTTDTPQNIHGFIVWTTRSLLKEINEYDQQYRYSLTKSREAFVTRINNIIERERSVQDGSELDSLRAETIQLAKDIRAMHVCIVALEDQALAAYVAFKFQPKFNDAVRLHKKAKAADTVEEIIEITKEFAKLYPANDDASGSQPSGAVSVYDELNNAAKTPEGIVRIVGILKGIRAALIEEYAQDSAAKARYRMESKLSDEFIKAHPNSSVQNIFLSMIKDPDSLSSAIRAVDGALYDLQTGRPLHEFGDDTLAVLYLVRISMNESPAGFLRTEESALARALRDQNQLSRILEKLGRLTAYQIDNYPHDDTQVYADYRIEFEDLQKMASEIAVLQQRINDGKPVLFITNKNLGFRILAEFENEYDRFYRETVAKIVEASRTSQTWNKTSWISFYARVVDFIRNIESQLSDDEIDYYARQVHDIGYFQGQSARAGNPMNAFVGGKITPAQETMLDSSRANVKRYFSKHDKPGSVKLNLSDVLPEKRSEFLRLSGKQFEDSQVSALDEQTNIFNSFAMSWDELLRDAENWNDMGAQKKFLRSKQTTAVAGTLVLLRMKGNLSDHEMNEATNAIWRYTGQFDGEYAWDGTDRNGQADPEGWRRSNPLVSKPLKDMSEDELAKDEPIWKAVKNAQAAKNSGSLTSLGTLEHAWRNLAVGSALFGVYAYGMFGFTLLFAAATGLVYAVTAYILVSWMRSGVQGEALREKTAKHLVAWWWEAPEIFWMGMQYGYDLVYKLKDQADKNHNARLMKFLENHPDAEEYMRTRYFALDKMVDGVFDYMMIGLVTSCLVMIAKGIFPDLASNSVWVKVSLHILFGPAAGFLFWKHGIHNFRNPEASLTSGAAEAVANGSRGRQSRVIASRIDQYLKNYEGILNKLKMARALNVSPGTLSNHGVSSKVKEINRLRAENEPGRKLIHENPLEAVKEFLRKHPGGLLRINREMSKSLKVSVRTIVNYVIRYDIAELVRNENERRKVSEPEKKLIALNVEDAIKFFLRDYNGVLKVSHLAQELGIPKRTADYYLHKDMVQAENERRMREEPSRILVSKNIDDVIKDYLKKHSGKFDVTAMAKELNVSRRTLFRRSLSKMARDENRRRLKSEPTRPLLSINPSNTSEHGALASLRIFLKYNPKTWIGRAWVRLYHAPLDEMKEINAIVEAIWMSDFTLAAERICNFLVGHYQLTPVKLNGDAKAKLAAQLASSNFSQSFDFTKAAEHISAFLSKSLKDPLSFSPQSHFVRANGILKIVSKIIQAREQGKNGNLANRFWHTLHNLRNIGRSEFSLSKPVGTLRISDLSGTVYIPREINSWEVSEAFYILKRYFGNILVRDITHAHIKFLLENDRIISISQLEALKTVLSNSGADLRSPFDGIDPAMAKEINRVITRVSEKEDEAFVARLDDIKLLDYWKSHLKREYRDRAEEFHREFMKLLDYKISEWKIKDLFRRSQPNSSHLYRFNDFEILGKALREIQRELVLKADAPSASGRPGSLNPFSDIYTRNWAGFVEGLLFPALTAVLAQVLSAHIPFMQDSATAQALAAFLTAGLGLFGLHFAIIGSIARFGDDLWTHVYWKDYVFNTSVYEVSLHASVTSALAALAFSNPLMSFPSVLVASLLTWRHYYMNTRAYGYEDELSQEYESAMDRIAPADWGGQRDMSILDRNSFGIRDIPALEKAYRATTKVLLFINTNPTSYISYRHPEEDVLRLRLGKIIKALERLPYKRPQPSAGNPDVGAGFGQSSLPSQARPDRNEDDSFVERLSNGITIAGVFDGLGKYSFADTASTIAKEKVQSALNKLNGSESESQIIKIMKGAMSAAEEAMSTTFKRKETGTTAVVAVVVPHKDGTTRVLVASAGDSRAYLRSRNGKLEPLTIDNLGADSIPRGHVLTLEEVRKRLRKSPQALLSSALNERDLHRLDTGASLFRNRNLTDNYLSGYSESDPIITVTTVQNGSQIILTSDGIHDNLTDREIQKIARTGTLTPERLARELVRTASIRGDQTHMRSKRDDMTAVVVSVQNPFARERQSRTFFDALRGISGMFVLFMLGGIVDSAWSAPMNAHPYAAAFAPALFFSVFAFGLGFIAAHTASKVARWAASAYASLRSRFLSANPVNQPKSPSAREEIALNIARAVFAAAALNGASSAASAQATGKAIQTVLGNPSNSVTSSINPVSDIAANISEDELRTAFNEVRRETNQTPSREDILRGASAMAEEGFIYGDFSANIANLKGNSLIVIRVRDNSEIDSAIHNANAALASRNKAQVVFAVSANVESSRIEAHEGYSAGPMKTAPVQDLKTLPDAINTALKLKAGAEIPFGANLLMMPQGSMSEIQEAMSDETFSSFISRNAFSFMWLNGLLSTPILRMNDMQSVFDAIAFIAKSA